MKVKKMKITNFERLKAMTIDEMAEFLSNNECARCCVFSDVVCEGNPNSDCFVGIKKWLEKYDELKEKLNLIENYNTVLSYNCNKFME